MPKTILVIDDEDQVRNMLKKLLETAGYAVLDAANGKIGLELYRNHDSIDLVITDIIMPEKEGIETIRELKTDYPDVKIMAMSGGCTIGSDEYLFLAKKIGVSKTLAKPFRMQEMLDSVKELIG